MIIYGSDGESITLEDGVLTVIGSAFIEVELDETREAFFRNDLSELDGMVDDEAIDILTHYAAALVELGNGEV